MKTNQPISDKPLIPKPAHPVNRREPLPWQCPKPSEDDPHAPARVQAILQSPSYRRADVDLDFLARDTMRGVRLQIDYFKPEILLEEHRIRHTIVVFGSTRICEPATAQRNGTRGRHGQQGIAAPPRNCRAGPCEEPRLATVGINVSPHLFRTAGASTAAIFASSAPHLASALRHHTDPAITHEHYNRPSSLSARPMPR